MKELRSLACALVLSTLTLLIYGAFVPGGAATASPAVTITQPNPGALVQGNVTVSVAYRSASGVNITDLELYVDKARYTSVKLDAPSTVGTYSFVWNTAGLPAGVHTVTAVAYDADGKPGDVAVSVYVDGQDGPDVHAPTVKLASPPSGTIVRGIVPLIANALDNAGVKMVLFFLNDRLLFGTNHPPFRYAWDTSKVANGAHSVRVYAYDAAENRGESQPIVLTVDNPSGRTLPNERPSTALTAPAQPTGQTPMAAAPERPTQPTGGEPTRVQGTNATARSPLPAPPPPLDFRPALKMSRTDLPLLPAVPSAGGPRAQQPSTPPVVARPQAPAASAYPEIVATFSRSEFSAGFAAPRSDVTPRANRRPTASVPAVRTTEVAVSGLSASRSRGEFAAAGLREGAAPDATLVPMATKPNVTMARAEAPFVVPMGEPGRAQSGSFSSAASRAAAPNTASRTAPAMGVAPTAMQVTDTPAVARAEAPSFEGARHRGGAPSSVGAPRVDASQLVPQLVAIVASVPTSLLQAGAREARLATPAGGLVAREMLTATVDTGQAAPEVIAVSTEGMVASLTPGMGGARLASPGTLGAVPSLGFEESQVVAVAPGHSDSLLAAGADAARLAAPSENGGAPTLTLGGQPAMQMAARPAAASQAEALLRASGARLAGPSGGVSGPSVSAPGTTSGVVVALMDRRTQRAVPVAMIHLQTSEPGGVRGQTAFPRKMVVAPRKGGAVSVVYNGKPVQFGEVSPFTKDGMTLTPFRNIMEVSGGVVLWNNLIKQVKATGDGRRIEFTIGDTQALVNSQAVRMDAAPLLKQGRAVVPMSFLRDALDVVVEYDPATGRVTIAAK